MNQYRIFVRLPWDTVALTQVVQADNIPDVMDKVQQYFGSCLCEFEYKIVCLRRCSKKVTISIDDIYLN
jgi:hypothetical protein